MAVLVQTEVSANVVAQFIHIGDPYSHGTNHMEQIKRQFMRPLLACLMTGITLLGLLASCTLPVSPVPAAQVEATTTSPAEAPSTETTPVAATAELTATEVATATELVTTTPTVTMAATSLPQETYKDIPVGFTSEGFAYRGNPDAPITMFEFSDYQCPFCSRYFIQTEPAINESYVRSGEVRVVFRDMPLVQLHPNAPAAHAAALCVADQGARLFWMMHDQLFQSQAEWQSLPDPNPYFLQLAEGIGADSAAYSACVEGGEKTATIEQGLAAARDLGFSGTPSFLFARAATDETFQLVGAQPYDQFAGLLDALIAGESPQQAAEPAEAGDQEIPFWASAEGLAPDPDRPGYNMAGDAYRGNIDAKVVVVEFSDFQCPFCRRHTEDTQPALDKTFVDTNQILWVFKNFPLSIHAQAPAAGVAVECAADQGKFWEMHALLFANVNTWSINDPNPVFSQLAEDLELDADQFATCLESDEAAQKVQSDMADGQQFVQGTPTFIVLFNGEGRIIPGALPVDQFTSALQEIIDTPAP